MWPRKQERDATYVVDVRLEERERLVKDGARLLLEGREELGDVFKDGNRVDCARESRQLRSIRQTQASLTEVAASDGGLGHVLVDSAHLPAEKVNSAARARRTTSAPS